MVQTMTAAATRLYDPARTLGDAKDIPTRRTTTAPTRLSVGNFRLPSGVVVNQATFESFAGIMSDLENQVGTNPRTHQAFVAASQRLLDLHHREVQQAQTNMVRELDKPHSERWAATRARWRAAFESDSEIGKNRRNTTLSRVKAMLAMYGKAAGERRLAQLLDYFTEAGGGDHPEMLRFLDWVAGKIARAAR